MAWLSTPLLVSREENIQKGPKAAAAEAGARRGEVTDCGRSNSMGSRAANEPSRSLKPQKRPLLRPAHERHNYDTLLNSGIMVG